MNNIMRRALRLLAGFVKWFVFLFILLITVATAGDAAAKHANGIDIVPYLIAVVALAIVALSIFPPVLSRLPKKLGVASYVAVLPALIAVVTTSMAASDAYKLTPKGAAEARVAALEAASAAKERAERERREAELARQQRESREADKALNDSLQFVADSQRKVQGCINWRGQIPDLVRRVKGNLHNPRSFEHVHTEMKVIGGDPKYGLPMVVMEYRAENGYGALRTEAVSAIIVPDDCSVRAMREGVNAADFEEG